MSTAALTPAQRRTRYGVFALTWLSYATYYLARKGFSVTKARIESRLGVSASWLATIDTAYLVAYAAGQFVAGVAGDRVGARRLVGWGMLGSAVACAVFGSAQGAIVMLLAFAANGLFQSTGWPGNTKAMADWYPPAERGTVMGAWSTCYQAGGLAATAFATALLGALGWRWAFFGPAIVVGGVGFLVLAALAERPGATRGAPSPPPSAEEIAVARAERRRVILSPMVWSFGAAYFCLKIIRYSILFWLPYYLHSALHYSEQKAGYLSISFEIGGIAGVFIAGALSDRVAGRRRSVLASVMMGLLAVSLLLYEIVAAWGAVPNFAAMALVGLLLFGPDSLLAGAAAQDLGGKYAAATATGFVNGMGSVGAILQGMFTVMLREHFGWGAVFYGFIAVAAIGALALAPTWRRAPEVAAT